MARKKVIIEARVNEYAMRDGNPNVPWSPEEIAGGRRRMLCSRGFDHPLPCKAR
jgi:hypothetical protein